MIREGYRPGIHRSLRAMLLLKVLFFAAVGSLFLGSVAPAQGKPPAAPTFSRSFAGTAGWVMPSERPYRVELSLNGSWRFQPVAVPPYADGHPPELPAPTATGWSSTPLKVPSPWNVNRWTVQGRGDGPGQPYHTDSVYYPSYPRAWDGVEMGWLRRSFRVPNDWTGGRLRIRFEAVAGPCQVFVNGKPVGENFDAFLPFELDVTDAVRRGAENELLVGVRAAHLWNHKGTTYEAFRAPYAPGSTLDHITGIWQDVTLLSVPSVRVADTFVQPKVGAGRLETEVTLQNETDRPHTVEVGGDVRPWINLAGKDVLSAPEERGRLGATALTIARKRVTIPAYGSTKVTIAAAGSTLKTWSPGAPNLYGLVVDVSEGGRTIDRHYTRFGWREFKIVGRNLSLNGKRIQLYGDLLHPFGPFIGSRRYVWAWYRMIKDMGGNAVRPHAQPHPRLYLDLADEMGICVLDETALFGSSIQLDFDSPEGWRRFEDHYDRLVLRDRNHASVFGWSMGNELFAMFFKVPEPKRARYYDRLKAYAQRSYRLDPTRQWVSCDGDEDLRGGVPVWSRHHGIGIPEVPDLAKPRMIGESGGSYYAKPGQLAPLNGDRAYESYAGRNEALAIDLYRNVTVLAKPKELAFFSASETAWFGLEHLPFGYTDRTRVPNLSDGVRFGPYREGQPGVQPERIPPFAMTLNPGFDPTLPLYRPLAMFEAFRAALRGEPLRPSRQDRANPGSVEPTNASVTFIGDRNGALARRLAGIGIPIGTDRSAVTVVDGATIQPGDVPRIKRRIEDALACGDTVFVAIGGDDATVVNEVLPAKIIVTARTATGLVPGEPNPTTAGFTLSNLYFAEDPVDPRILRRGLAGPFVERGEVLLRASDTDWTLFNDLSEEEKGSNVLIYEGLIKPGGAALVQRFAGAGGRILVSAIDYERTSEGRTQLWRRLFANLGVILSEPKSAWALPTARDASPPQGWRYTTSTPVAGWKEREFDASAWSTGEGGFGTETPGSRSRTRWTTGDIWLRTAFTLGAEELRELALHVYHDEDVEVFVNGVAVYAARGHTQDYAAVPMTGDALRAFRAGENIIAVHCHQTAGGQYIDVGVSKGGSAGTIREYDPLRDGPKDPPPASH